MRRHFKASGILTGPTIDLLMNDNYNARPTTIRIPDQI